MPQRQAGKVLGVSQRTISNDCSESEQKLLTRDEKEAEVKSVNAKLPVRFDQATSVV